MRLSLPTLVFALVACSFTGFSQVTVTYGGLNNPDLPALAGAEYMAKVDDNHVFVSSGTQGALTLISFDENSPNNPFTMLAKWEGMVDGNNLETVKDIHFDAASDKLYVVQQSPSMLKVFDVNMVSNSLSFDSEIELTGMNYPERFAMTADLLLVTDMTEGQVADISYSSGLSLIGVHNLTTCGTAGQYKDVEISPDGAYMYVTVFSPASVVKFSLAPTGASCEGVIDINALVGTSLMGDLEFISPNRAQVIACIGSGGVVRMDANGDLVDPIINSMSLFDPMKSIFIPGDSLLLVQSSGTGGATFKVESDFSLTQIANTAYMRDYNNELVTMAGGNLVRVENHDGFLGLITEQQDGSFEEVSRRYNGAFGYGAAAFHNGMSVSPSGDRILVTAGANDLALFTQNGNGMPVLDQTLPSPIDLSNGYLQFVTNNRVVGFSGMSQEAQLIQIDEVNGTATMLDQASMTNVPATFNWSTAYETAGQTMLAAPAEGNSIFYLGVLGSTISGATEVALPGINALSRLSLAVAPSGSKAYVLAEYNCAAHLVELERFVQSWSVVGSTEIGGVMSWSCDDHSITFLENENRIAIAGDGNVTVLDVSGAPSLLTTYEVTGLAPSYVVGQVSFNPTFNQVVLTASDWNGFQSFHSQVLFLGYSSGAVYSQVASFVDQVGNVSGMERISMIDMTSDGSLVYAMDPNGDIIHTFGVADITVGIEEEANSAFLAYPNPTTANVTLNFKSDFSGVVSVLDNTGRVVSTQAFNGTNLTLDMDDLSTGLYHVRTLSNDGELNTTSVVKN